MNEGNERVVAVLAFGIVELVDSVKSKEMLSSYAQT